MGHSLLVQEVELALSTSEMMYDGSDVTDRRGAVAVVSVFELSQKNGQGHMIQEVTWGSVL